ncbi:(d)CMP kinase [Lyticum sinuosum]|uniref:Cytidylate kinase n=1 Tax=Lyticum sinuosum TaxID=1332059 RepID=A0AAE5AGR3_9RICK|nr:(d)CMP kinase [Lyticum sinuosum]MDZ5761102.1 Cytidylate kinase [Lyticum sinuosum]
MNIITIDGPAAAGKGTIALSLSHLINFYYFNTGNIFRYIAKTIIDEGLMYEFLINKNHFNLNKINQNVVFLKEIPDLVEKSILIDEKLLRTQEISDSSSIIAEIPQVREILNKAMRKFIYDMLGSNKVVGCIVDGRDTGSVLFPNAGCKIFITAERSVRTQRRFEQIRSTFTEDFQEEIKKKRVHDSLVLRDSRDGSRKRDPMIIVKDTIVIDTSKISQEETIEQILAIIRIKLPDLSKDYRKTVNFI